MPRPIEITDQTHFACRTRTGDQLHLAYVRQALTRDDGTVLPARIWQRTSCGCRVALVIGQDIKVRPGLLCEKCFTPGQVAAFNDASHPAKLNVNLI